MRLVIIVNAILCVLRLAHSIELHDKRKNARVHPFA